MSSQSIVEYFAEHEGYRCGYCKSPNTNFSHGMWAHSLTPEDYEDLLNRGWRRSGMYCYKPTNSITCCPMYTISCKALEFRISKSQKKVLKRFNVYVQGGELEPRKGTTNYEDSMDGEGDVKESLNIRKGVELGVEATPSSFSPTQRLPVLQDSSTESCGVNELKEKQPLTHLPNSGSRTDRNCYSEPVSSTSMHPPRLRKSKEIRLERKKMKLAQRGIADVSAFITSKKVEEQKQKQIEEHMKDFGRGKRKYTVKLIRTSSKEFQLTLNVEFELYKKYQMTIHGDKEDECSLKQFKRFLCDSPLNGENHSEDFCGSYHQQYYVDDNLIAVGVVDILPSALSSVYFFYDPVYMSLSLGTFGALNEISCVRELHMKHDKFKYYYMGFYIHSCTKMRYKGSFSPSYLLCPETYSWIPLDDKLRRILEEKKYCAFGAASNLESSQTEASRIGDINKVSILYRRSILPYEIYELRKGTEDKAEIQQYCNLVGDTVAERLLLYRS